MFTKAMECLEWHAIKCVWLMKCDLQFECRLESWACDKESRLGNFIYIKLDKLFDTWYLNHVTRFNSQPKFWKLVGVNVTSS